MVTNQNDLCEKQFLVDVHPINESFFQFKSFRSDIEQLTLFMLGTIFAYDFDFFFFFFSRKLDLTFHENCQLRQFV